MNNEIKQHIIDPVDEEDKIVQINSNKLIYKHYSHLINFLKGEESKVIELENFQNIKFKVIDFESFNCSIGLAKDVYCLLKPLVEKETLKQEDLRDINKKVNHVLDSFEGFSKNNSKNESIYIGIDGIIVLAKEPGDGIYVQGF
ncbi:hypothetical protein [Metabacillus fastidiosus]|uniref:hypothetical protein n=1 Tax=Metabacillus fastidiosus TaxID=1458 RepID=UPI003D291012